MTRQYHGYTGTPANADLDAIVAAAAALSAAAVSYPILPGEAGVTNVKAAYGNPLRYGGTGLGIASDRAALLAANVAAAAFASIVSVTLPAGTWKVSADLTFSKPVIALPGAVLALDAGVAVTFGDAFYGGIGTHFTLGNSTSRAKFTAGTIAVVRPEWWGARTGNVVESGPAIQNAIDATIYGGARCKVELLGGLYKVATDTLHLGYGDSFRSAIIEGPNYAYDSSGGFNGAAFVTTKTDRPTLNVQGARGSAIRRVGFFGKLDTYLNAHSFGQPAGAAAGFDDTLAAQWDDPALGGATLDSRYAPYAAVTIDAYAGAQPGTAYPAVTYPGWSGIVAQYGKANSSDVLLEDVYIQGYTAAVAVQPADTDANGDFTTLRRVQVFACKYGVSVGNTQSRNVELTGFKATLIHTILTNNKHGRQSGKFGGAITDLSSGSAVQLVDFGSAYPGPVVFINTYAEALWRVGLMASGGASANSYIFEGGLLDFSGQNDVRGYPAYICAAAETGGGGGASPVDVQWNGITFNNFSSVCQLAHSGNALNGCFFQPASARANPYEKFAHNATAGGLVTFQLRSPMRSRVRFTQFNLDTAAVVATIITDKVTTGTRPFCVPWYAEAVGATNENYDDLPRPVARAQSIDKTTLTGVSLVGRTLTFTMTALPDGQALQYGPLPGDVLWDDTSGSVFFVRSRVTTTIIAELQNNYKFVGGIATPTNAYALNVGNLYVRNSRIFVPQYYLRGDVTAASANIANCARDDGFAAWYDAQISVGDALIVRDTQDSFVNFANAVIAARSQAAGTITLSGGASKTQAKRRLDWFARSGPANV